MNCLVTALTFGFAISASVAVARPINSTPTPLPTDRDPCALFTDNATYVSQTLIMALETRRVEFHVPEAFFEDFWDRRDGFEDTAQLFRVEIGSFLPVTRAETGRRNKQGIWNWMEFVLSDSIPLDEVAEYSVDNWLQPLDPDHGLAMYARSAGPFGLVSIQSARKPPIKVSQSDTYLAESPDEGLTTVLNCSVPDDGPGSPICLHYFRAAGMDVKLHYRRIELSNWQAFQADVTRFLNCATAPKS